MVDTVPEQGAPPHQPGTLKRPPSKGVADQPTKPRILLQGPTRDPASGVVDKTRVAWAYTLSKGPSARHVQRGPGQSRL